MIILNVQNIGKSYRSYRSELLRFLHWLGFPIKPSIETWVLKHMSFQLEKGEAIGIIGENGAGKSTLLKIIAGTLQPSEGKISLAGRVSAILELGMGFNPDLTGRQNAYHASGLMGFNPQQISKLMPKIESFSEIGDSFDDPIRTYSTGMQMRLAFAVATAERPDVLIVDEALAVGDTYFQHKSFNQIQEFQKLGTSLILVSHDRSSIQSLCDRCVLLEKGTMIKEGIPEEVFDFYNATIAEKENSSIELYDIGEGKVQTKSGTGEARVEDVRLLNENGEISEYIKIGENVEIQVLVKIYSPIETLVMGYGIRDRLGQVLYGTNTWYTDQVVLDPIPGATYLFRIKFPANFGFGSYSIQVALVDREHHLTSNYEWTDVALVFNVVNVDKVQFVGSQWNEPTILIERKEPISEIP